MITVTVTEKNSSQVVCRLTSDAFMLYAKEHFGIGRNQFLDDYIKVYNEKNDSNLHAKMTIDAIDNK
jgi:hypothetical protein